MKMNRQFDDEIYSDEYFCDDICLSDYEKEVDFVSLKNNVNSEKNKSICKHEINWNEIKENNINLIPKTEQVHNKMSVNLFEENLKQIISKDDIIGFEKVIKNGLSENYIFSSKLNILSFAVLIHKVDFIDYLLKLKFSDQQGSIPSIIVLCSRQCLNKLDIDNSLKILDILKTHNIDLNLKSNENHNALHYCIKYKNYHLLYHLINNISLFENDNYGISPIMLACNIGDLNALEIILTCHILTEVEIDELNKIIKNINNPSIINYIQAYLSRSKEENNTIDVYSMITDNSYEKINQYETLYKLLDSTGFSHLLPVFQKNSIKYSDLFKMDPAFFEKRLGIDSNDIENLKRLTFEMITKNFDKNSYMFNKKSNINAIDICMIIQNICEHLSFLEDTSLFLTENLQILELDNNLIIHQALISQIDKLKKHSNSLTTIIDKLRPKYIEDSIIYKGKSKLRKVVLITVEITMLSLLGLSLLRYFYK